MFGVNRVGVIVTWNLGDLWGDVGYILVCVCFGCLERDGYGC